MGAGRKGEEGRKTEEMNEDRGVRREEGKGRGKT